MCTEGDTTNTGGRQKCNFSKDSEQRLILFICHNRLMAGFKTVMRLSSTCALKADGENSRTYKAFNKGNFK